jgi:predicted ATPase
MHPWPIREGPLTAIPLLTLVGRDHELTVLRTQLEAAIAGRGSLVLISGEAGVGKTALDNVLVHEATGVGAQSLTGHSYDRTETPPYGPWIEIAQHFQSLPHAADAPPVPRLDGATSQANLFTQIRTFLTAATAECPLVLVLEDLHWADTASFALLRFLAHSLASLPLLLVVTYRADEMHRRHPLHTLVPLLVREAQAERLALRPLDAAAIRLLVQARYELPDDFGARLTAYQIERTEGNALFVTELLRTLEEDRVLHRQNGGWRMEPIIDAPVPLLLHQFIDARLTRLGDEADALLAYAAVIGQEVPLAVWRAVTGVEEETLADVAEGAQVAHLVAAWPDRQGIRFTHALVREVLYESVPPCDVGGCTSGWPRRSLTSPHRTRMR